MLFRCNQAILFSTRALRFFLLSSFRSVHITMEVFNGLLSTSSSIIAITSSICVLVGVFEAEFFQHANSYDYQYLLYHAVIAVYRLQFHPLSKFSESRFAAVSRIPLTWAVFKGKSYDYTNRVHERYEPIVRVALIELIIRTSAAWKDIYTHRPQIQKESADQTQPVNRAQSLLTADGARSSASATNPLSRLLGQDHAIFPRGSPSVAGGIGGVLENGEFSGSLWIG